MFIPLQDTNKLVNIHLQYMTLLIIALNVVIWVAFFAPNLEDVSGAQQLYYTYGFIPAVEFGTLELPPELTQLPPYMTFVSYAFLHGEFMHLAGNMLFLWVFGDNVEDSMGHLKFLIFYFLCAASGALFHGLISLHSEAPLVGASGAGAGLVGAYLILHPKVRIWVLALGSIPLKISALWLLTSWIVYQIGSLILFPDSEVSWAAHIGGFVAGLIFLPIFKKSHVKLFDQDLQPSNVSKEPEQLMKENTKPVKWGREG